MYTGSPTQPMTAGITSGMDVGMQIPALALWKAG
jgi:hypothetical protein